MPGLSAFDVSLAAVGLFIVYSWLQPKPVAPLPPGPKGFPVIGNVADMPTEKEWETFAEWGRKWGGICSVTLVGRPMIIVNSAKIMDELDKKGAVYSDRPRLEMGGELVGYAKNLVLIPYGARFRNFRKLVARTIGSSSAIQPFLSTQESETQRFLQRVLANPSSEALNANLRHTAGGIILRVAYGIEVQERDDPFVSLIEHANDNFNLATKPGAFMVDFFPILRHVPDWFPGAGFKIKARVWAKSTSDMVEIPHAYVKKQMAAGTAVPSFTSNLLEQENELTADDIHDIKYVSSSLYGAGADTTVSAQYAFFLAMVLNPEVQELAQAEISAVVGVDRLPAFTDREHLPYVNAVVSEVLRWNNVAPTGVPHTATEDGIIAGYFIPKGAIIITNLWAMLHDPQIYPDPFAFDPSRHIATPEKAAQLDPRHACFGYGRRICAGIHLAEASLFILIARTLAVFHISKAMENGVEVTPAHENTSGIISHPKPFKCTIKPRSEKAMSLILEGH